ncbi:unnamed protein product [Adineta ricciae]|uniref:Uncharacterized protein n=1 Tax=Adineta ricciae TaxID=249248 RepID=A0A814RK53_ADIRI|nr:unnamed protein product [Adineta ricciae]
MLLGNLREDHHSDCRISQSAPHLIASVPKNDPFISQQAMMSYARMSYRYTTVTLLSMRPPPELTMFPDHLVERRFLDEENYIDLDRMLAEKAGKFQMDSYGTQDGAGDGPSTLFKTSKRDVSSPNVSEKVKNRRPKDPLTPHQVAALTSTATRHQTSTIPTPLLTSQSIPPLPHISIDDYNHRQTQIQRSMSYQRQNSNHFQTQPHQVRSLLPDYRTSRTQNTTPILQRLCQAHERQHKNDLSPPCTNHPHRGQSVFCTPVSPEQSANSQKTFAWPFSTNPNQRSAAHPIHIPMATQSIVNQNQNVLSQLLANHIPRSTIMQTPSTPAVHIPAFNNSNTEDDNDDDDDDEQNFYSAPPSPTQQEEFSTSAFNNSSNPEHTRIYNQAVLLNSLIRNMVNENNVQNSSSNESCSSNDTQSASWNQESNASYTEMYNLIRLLSPGVKNVAQQELLQYLEQGCSNEREDMFRLIRTLSIDEQNSLKPVLVRLINEQLDIMKTQQQIQQGHSISIEQGYSPTNRSSLESWFGSDIYKNAYPRMPSGRVVSAHDLETSRLS